MDVELLEKFLEENGGTSELLRHIPPKEITISRLNDITRRLGEEGTFLVIAHYGTLANAVCGGSGVPSDIVRAAIQIIHKSLNILQKDLRELPSGERSWSPEKLLGLRRALAVHAYLVHRALSGAMERQAGLELEQADMAGPSVPRGKRGKGGKSKPRTSSFVADDDAERESWDSRRSLLVEDLLGVMECPVDKIWDEENTCGFSLPRLLIRTICTSLNESKGALGGGPEAYKILGILAKRFNKQEDVLSRLIPLVKISEEAGRVVGRAIAILVTEFELNETVPVALRGALELAQGMALKDLNAEKGISAFILELCEQVPEPVIVISTNTLIDFLAMDSGAIRSSVLTGAWTLLKWLGEKEGGGPGGRMMRDCFIERMLLLHARDVNALVRSRALTLLQKLVQGDDLEATEVAVVLESLGPRLKDKAVSVRKHAVALLSAILERYPVIVKTDENYRAEVDSTRKRVLELLVRKSPRKAKMIYGLVREFLDQVHHYPQPLPEKYEPLENMDQVRGLITECVTREEWWEACIVLWHAFDRFGRAAGFSDVAEMTGVANIYLSYFNLSAEVDTDELEESLNVSQSQGRSRHHRSHRQEESDVPGYVEPEEVAVERKKLRFFQGCERMQRLIPGVVQGVASLLDSGSEVDRREMIGVVGLLVRCGLQVTPKLTASVVKAISQMGQDSAADILPAFWSIFIGEDDIGNVPLVKKLFGLLSTVTPTVKEHLKPIIAEMHKTKRLSKPVLMILWDAYTGKAGGSWTPEEAKAAVFVLGIAGARDRAIIVQNMGWLVERGLAAETASERMSLTKATLEAILQALKRSKKGESDIKDTVRFGVDAELFVRLDWLLQWGLGHAGNAETDYNFPAVAELAVQIIYRLCWKPQILTQRLLQTIPNIVFGDGKTPPTSEIKDTERVHIRYLSLLRSLLGGHISFHENVVLPEVKRRKGLLQNSAEAAAAKKNSKGKNQRSGSKKSTTLGDVSRASSVSNLSRGSSRSNMSLASNAGNSSSNTTANNEMDVMIGSVGYDNEQEVVRNFIEKLLDGGVFRHFRVLTLNFCRNLGKTKSLRLQLECVKALAKIMSVSAESVSKHMEMFLGLWAVGQSSLVKIEMVKQCTILNIRFPNQMEECNKVVQLGLRGNDVLVKSACLDFMTYLALGELVKVRDYIADVALLLCDPAPSIRDTAKDFFNVCADKDNVLSNAVPEVISRLSAKADLSQPAFQQIMKFLLVRVTKEKQVLGLVEKLLGRLRTPGSGDAAERGWQDTAFCLAQLPLPERSLKLLRDNAGAYLDKLGDDGIHDAFIGVVENLRRIDKPELAAKIDEFEGELEEARAKCLETRRIEKAAKRQENKEDGRMDESSDMEGEVRESEEEEAVAGEPSGGEEVGAGSEEEEGGADGSVRSSRRTTPRSLPQTKKNGNAPDEMEESTEEEDEEEEPMRRNRRAAATLQRSTREKIIPKKEPVEEQELSEEESVGEEKAPVQRRSGRPAAVTPQRTSRRGKIVREEEVSDEEEEPVRKKAVRKAVGVKKGKATAGSSRGKKQAPVIEEDEEDPEQVVFSDSD